MRIHQCLDNSVGYPSLELVISYFCTFVKNPIIPGRFIHPTLACAFQIIQSQVVRVGGQLLKGFYKWAGLLFLPNKLEDPLGMIHWQLRSYRMRVITIYGRKNLGESSKPFNDQR
jgi:hypothetical protein